MDSENKSKSSDVDEKIQTQSEEVAPGQIEKDEENHDMSEDELEDEPTVVEDLEEHKEIKNETLNRDMEFKMEEIQEKVVETLPKVAENDKKRTEVKIKRTRGPPQSPASIVSSNIMSLESQKLPNPDLMTDFELEGKSVRVLSPDPVSEKWKKLSILRQQEKEVIRRRDKKKITRQKIIRRGLERKFSEIPTLGFGSDNPQSGHSAGSHGLDHEETVDEREQRRRITVRKKMMEFYLKDITLGISEATNHRQNFAWVITRVHVIYFYWSSFWVLVAALGALANYVFRILPDIYSRQFLRDIFLPPTRPFLNIFLIIVAIGTLSTIGGLTMAYPNPKSNWIRKGRWVAIFFLQVFLTASLVGQSLDLIRVHESLESRMVDHLHERPSPLRNLTQWYFQCCGVKIGHSEWNQVIRWSNNTLDKGGYPLTCCNYLQNNCFYPIHSKEVIPITDKIKGVSRSQRRSILWPRPCFNRELRMVYVVGGISSLILAFTIISSIPFALFTLSTVRIVNQVEGNLAIKLNR